MLKELYCMLEELGFIPESSNASLGWRYHPNVGVALQLCLELVSVPCAWGDAVPRPIKRLYII
jgi:hypothetical protein